MKTASIFATDFDGTLLRTDGTFSAEDLQGLQLLRDSGCAVLLASGRSPYSLRRCLDGRELPVDWFVLSSGAGVLNGKGTVMLSHTLSAKETLEVHSAFAALGIEDISIQGPFPEAHRLHWIPGNHGSDFTARLELYRGFNTRIDSAEMPSSEVMGFVSGKEVPEVLERLAGVLGDRYSIIRATSPIDHRTVWVEVFPRGVTKASACEFIRKELGVDRKATAAVGNDWNDIHMLEWAAVPFVVKNSPPELLKRFRQVPSNDSGGVSTAAAAWLEMTS